MDKWRMTFDLHTHTRLMRGERTITHAVSTMEEVVAAAREKGLRAVGISNHGPGHVTYGLPMESVAALTFSGCVFLRNVSLPASVQHLGARAFLGCKRLEQVTLGERVVPPALLNNEFRPPLLAEEPFPVPAPRIIPPEIHVGWRAWLASGGRKNALDQQCCDFLRESGEKVCAALGYHEETLKYLARNQLITREVALRAAAECSARGFVEATALLMELAQGLSLDDGLDL